MSRRTGFCSCASPGASNAGRTATLGSSRERVSHERHVSHPSLVLSGITRWHKAIYCRAERIRLLRQDAFRERYRFAAVSEPNVHLPGPAELRWVRGVGTGRNALDHGVIVRCVEVHDRQPPRGLAGIKRRIHHTVQVDRQRSLVHCAIMSPRLTMNAPGTGRTSCHCPSVPMTWRPPGLSSVISNVSVPKSVCAPLRTCPGAGGC